MRSQCRLLLWPLLGIVCSPLLCVQVCLAGDDDSWRQRFFAEAPRKWAEYLLRSERFQGTASFAHVNMLAGEKWTEKGSSEFKQNRERGGAIFGGVVEDARGERRDLHGVNSRYEFELSRLDAGSPWVLARWKPISSAEPHSTALANSAIDLWTHPALQFMFAEDQLPRLIKQAEFTVHAVTPVSLGERQLVKVKFVYRPKKIDSPKPRPNDGWVLLDPDRYWVIQKYEISTVWVGEGTSGKSSWVGTNEYEDGVGGLPIPKRVVRRLKEVDRGKAVDMEHREEFKIVEGDVPESEFFLSAFGLPEPVEPNSQNEPVGLTSQKSMPPYLWVLIGVGIFALLAVGFRYLARRQHAAGA